jgi:hypothetical protein
VNGNVESVDYGATAIFSSNLELATDTDRSSFDGYIDQLRIGKAALFSTSGFTPPNQASYDPTYESVLLPSSIVLSTATVQSIVLPGANPNYSTAITTASMYVNGPLSNNRSDYFGQVLGSTIVLPQGSNNYINLAYYSGTGDTTIDISDIKGIGSGNVSYYIKIYNGTNTSTNILISGANNNNTTQSLASQGQIMYIFHAVSGDAFGYFI